MGRNIYVILTDTGTIFTRLIKLYTRKPFNHASIALDDQLTNVYSFGRKKPNNPFIGGFVKENIRCPLFKRAKCAIYQCTISDQQYHKLIKNIGIIEENKQQYKYNLLGLFAVMMNMELDRKNAFFCSQFVATILQNSGLDIIKHKPASLITPHDIKESESFQLVYEGRLSSFINGNNKQEFFSKYRETFARVI